MEWTGKVADITAPQEVKTSKGVKNKYQILLANDRTQYTKSLAFDVWEGDENNYQMDKAYKVLFDCSAFLFNGRYYNNLRIWNTKEWLGELPTEEPKYIFDEEEKTPRERKLEQEIALLKEENAKLLVQLGKKLDGDENTFPF